MTIGFCEHKKCFFFFFAQISVLTPITRVWNCTSRHCEILYLRTYPAALYLPRMFATKLGNGIRPIRIKPSWTGTLSCCRINDEYNIRMCLVTTWNVFRSMVWAAAGFRATNVSHVLRAAGRRHTCVMYCCFPSARRCPRDAQLQVPRNTPIIIIIIIIITKWLFIVITKLRSTGCTKIRRFLRVTIVFEISYFVLRIYEIVVLVRYCVRFRVVRDKCATIVVCFLREIVIGYAKHVQCFRLIISSQTREIGFCLSSTSFVQTAIRLILLNVNLV